MESQPLLIMLIENSDDHAQVITKTVTESELICRIIRLIDAESGLDYLLGELQSSRREEYPYPDLILLNLSLPGMSGLDFLKQLKRNHNLESIPVVVIANSEQQKETEISYKLGALNHIIENTNPDELMEKLFELLISCPESV